MRGGGGQQRPSNLGREGQLIPESPLTSKAGHRPVLTRDCCCLLEGASGGCWCIGTVRLEMSFVL